ncbi:MAG: thioredoxin domain-containing protein [Patescibacteria group bacterium]
MEQEQQMTKRQRRELKKQEKALARERQVKRTKIIRWSVWTGAVAIILGIWYLGFFRASDTYTNSNGEVRANPTLGGADAAVVVTEFSDFSCPACAATAPVVKEVAEAYGDQIRVEFNGFNLQHTWSEKSHEAGECALDQGKFWEFHDIIFSRQSEWVSADNALDTFAAYAEEAGLDRAAFVTCLDSGEMADEVGRDTSVARANGIDATPTFSIGDEKVVGGQTFEEFKRIIDGQLGIEPAAE